MDGLERRVGGRARVVRANILDPPGRELARRWGVRVVPTFLVLDPGGRELWRGEGRPPPRGLILRYLLGPSP